MDSNGRHVQIPILFLTCDAPAIDKFTGRSHNGKKKNGLKTSGYSLPDDRQLPRRRSRRPQPKQKAAKGKGRGKNSAELPSYGPQSLPAMPSVDPPWLASLNAAPAPGSNASQPTATGLLETKEDKECDRQMKSLVAALRRRKDELPEDLQTLVKEVTVRSGQEETKLLHSAVSQHGRAKKEVSEAQAARLQMHAAWRNFLEQSVEQWTRYTAQFVEQEKQLMDRLKQAQDSLLAAKENLGACKSCGRSHRQGRDGPDERWRGSRCQGHRGDRKPENSRKLQGLGLKSPDPPLSGRTGSRDRSRARISYANAQGLQPPRRLQVHPNPIRRLLACPSEYPCQVYCSRAVQATCIRGIFQELPPGKCNDRSADIRSCSLLFLTQQ